MSDNLELQIKDFQIIEGAKMVFVPGLNVIQGESNNGKTAIFRAAKSAIFNVPGTTSIRYGADQYVVALAYRGHTVIYVKGAESYYLIDGERYNKPGKVQLEDVAKALNMKLVDVNGATEQINFWDQMDKPFLLDRTPTELFRFIVDSGKDDNIVQCMANMVSDRQSINKQINASEGSIAQLNQQIAEATAALTNADKKMNACESIILLGPQVARKEELTTASKAISTIRDNIDTIKANTSVNEDTINILRNIKDKIQVSESRNEVLRNIKIKIEGLQQNKQITQTAMQTSKYVDIPDTSLDKLKSLQLLNTRINNIKDNIEGLHNSQPVVVNLDGLDRIKTLVMYKAKVDECHKRIEGLNEKLEQNKNELSGLHKLYDMIDIKICPTCGQIIKN